MLRVLDASKIVVLASASLLADAEANERLRRAVRAQDVLVLAMPKGEPNLETLQPIIGELRRFLPDWIVAAGGGSVIDGAKIAWIFYEQPDIDLERLTRPFSLPPLRSHARFAAIPTTAGTGSEVSSSALFVERSHRGKHVVVSHELLPDVVALDPCLTTAVPRSAAAAAGLDALAHAVEGYASRFENPLADLLAEQAIRVLLTDLTTSIEEPMDLDRRLRVMHAACMAGWVQNLKVPGAGHAIAHQLSRFDLAHGLCTGALLAPALRYNCGEPGVRSKYDRLAATLGLEDALALAARIETLCLTLDVALPVAHAIEASDPDLLRGALDDPCARANPRLLDEQAVQSILETAMA